MNQTRGLRILATLFLLNIAIISWSELRINKTAAVSPIGWPRPSRFVGLGVTWSLLAVFAEIASAELAAVIGAGLTLGLIMQNVGGNNSSSNPEPTVPGSTEGSQGNGGNRPSGPPKSPSPNTPTSFQV